MNIFLVEKKNISKYLIEMMQPLQVLQVLTDTEDVEQLLDVVFVLNSVSQLFSPTTRENHQIFL